MLPNRSVTESSRPFFDDILQLSQHTTTTRSCAAGAGAKGTGFMRFKVDRKVNNFFSTSFLHIGIDDQKASEDWSKITADVLVGNKKTGSSFKQCPL